MPERTETAYTAFSRLRTAQHKCDGEKTALSAFCEAGFSASPRLADFDAADHHQPRADRLATLSPEAQRA